jgi:hypothetical protein
MKKKKDLKINDKKRREVTLNVDAPTQSMSKKKKKKKKKKKSWNVKFLFFQ